MRLTATAIEDVMIVDVERLCDARGFFARTYCADEFERMRLSSHLAQCNISFNARRATLRGMHYQMAPHEETKLVRCTQGAIFDVVIDLRRHSTTYLRWFGIELSSDNRTALYIGPGMAHGFVTLADATEVFYQMSEPFQAHAASGVRWNDPRFGIEWPLQPQVISDRDAAYDDYSE